MRRKTFYIIIALGLSVIFVYTLLCIFFFKHMGIQIFRTTILKHLFAFLIIIYEISCAKKVMRTIGLAILPLTIIGFLFRIMLWPFGQLIFMSSLLIIAITLVLNAIKTDNNRLDKIIILIYPFSRALIMTNHFIGSTFIWWTSEVVIIGLTAIFIWVRLKNRAVLKND